MSDNKPRRVLPVSTIVQLIVWSVVVGVIFSALDITPRNLVERLGFIVRRIYDLGFGAFHWAFQYFLLGAVIVVPIWLVMRLLRGRNNGQR
jgi:Family of unknown function (DUF6460)